MEFDHLIDVAILSHGFTPYSRDYVFHIEALWGGSDAGQYLVLFKHCYEMNYKVVTKSSTLVHSWDDHFTDMEKYRSAGEPVGYVWGTDWRTAYPGFQKIENSDRAKQWTESLGKQMHEVELKAEILQFNLVYHEWELQHLNSVTTLIDQVVFPINKAVQF